MNFLSDADEDQVSHNIVRQVRYASGVDNKLITGTGIDAIRQLTWVKLDWQRQADLTKAQGDGDAAPSHPNFSAT